MNDVYISAAHAPPEPYLPTGWKLMAFESLDSTNSALLRLIESGAELTEGTLMWANTQTGGRGRAGRTWEGPPGNVYASYLIAAPARAQDAPQIGFVAARAVADTILDLPRHNTAPPKVTCKWPNDVLVEGAKASGILPELASAAGKNWIVLGIGINLKSVEVANPAYPVTALADHHIDTTAGHVLTVLSRFLAAGLATWRDQGFEATRAAWLEMGPEIGAPVTVNPGKGPVTGAFGGLDTDGALLLDGPGGRQRILAGDVLLGGA
ncbi:MAG: biotin--[acetyl-CoA-carboxylase] ligase [Rhodospirillaceae bacterium]|nr:biotin--[acetyl-CoA-carboxylase] ligase [Rhodospirillaceae bacterium]